MGFDHFSVLTRNYRVVLEKMIMLLTYISGKYIAQLEALSVIRGQN
jgi:hypothetical protein